MTKTATQKHKQKKVLCGWDTSDDDEILRRQLRAETEQPQIKAIEQDKKYYGSYRVFSSSGFDYLVEIRSLSARINSCSCPDYQNNQLGTCKHIEAVLIKMRKAGKRKFKAATEQGSPRIEIFIDRSCGNIACVQFPKNMRPQSKAYQAIAPFFSENGTALGKVTHVIPTIQRILDDVSARVRKQVRLSEHTSDVFEYQHSQEQRQQELEIFQADIAKGKRSLDVLKLPLLDYQRQGMLHLAFTGRALLADDMGLGKTVQAIAACELLRQLKNIKRVLVVATATLKAEWEEQIQKFTDTSIMIINGTRADRLKQYQKSAFFYITNYEQVVRDQQEIQRLIAPDVVILDEAQRIKNWQTKTAGVLKQLKSPYAFVLTGTPLENKIDDIYSIVQFLDPNIFGPLFRFNREFYSFSDKGKPVGYKNLDALYRRLKPVMLRRTKHEVEDQLPKRSIKHYYVSMSAEQRARYDEYKSKLAKLMHKAQRHPLTKEEHIRIQNCLACMRMLCDTTYILDPDTRISPKIDELACILPELLSDPSNKIIIFSEWERMLQLVRDLTEKLTVDFAWHTGSVNQVKRRQEINRFKSDPNTRLFLSTDAGSVGLNLQAANIVINLDLPWNPAKLEQRIARVWRKYQTKHVQVINIVCEDSIEHKMQDLLQQKQLLSTVVIDGDESLTAMALPSTRQALMQKLNEVLNEELPPSDNVQTTKQASRTDPIKALQQAVLARYPNDVEIFSPNEASDCKQLITAVTRTQNSELSSFIQECFHKHFPDNQSDLEILDSATIALLKRLHATDAITINNAYLQKHITGNSSNHSQEKIDARRHKANQYLSQAKHKLKMAKLLKDGEFFDESIPPLCDSIEFLIFSYAWLKGVGETCEGNEVDSVIENLVSKQNLPAQTKQTYALLSNIKETVSVESLAEHIQSVDTYSEFVESTQLEMLL